MADKKKMSVADMIAAAKKTDGGGASTPESESAPEETAAPAASAETPAPKADAGKPAPAKSASGGRMSVAEMLAAARGGAGAAPASATPAPPSEKKSAPKPAAKPAAAEKVEAAAPFERDSASILAAARKSNKAGPMSKAEAAAKEKSDPVVKEKPKVFVPPMPEKPAYALPKPAVKGKEKEKVASDSSRRDFLSIGFWTLGAASLLWTLASVKFMFPNVRREPPSKFKVGFPDAFAPGQVQTKFIPQFGVWVVNSEFDGVQQIYALKSVCTHLGCTPNWLEAEQKFKCPCHGSGFYKDGINFEGPAPRPLERYAIRIADDGQIEIDKSRTFQEEMGQWQDASSFIPV